MTADKPGIATTLLRAAWLSIVLGVTIEVALLATALAFGKLETPEPFLADLAGKLSWSVLVCAGISIGTVAGRASGAAMGLLGLLAAPLAFTLAKTAHKTAAQALSVGLTPGPGPTTTQFVVLRAIECAWLGLAVGYLVSRARGRLPAYAALGLATGGAAAAIVVLLTIRAAEPDPVPAFALVSKGVNEVLFPLGCSLVLYAVNLLGSRVRLAAAV